VNSLTLVKRTQKQRLLLFDPAALNHVLVTHAYEYPRPEEARSALAMILGKGVLFVDGACLRPSRSLSLRSPVPE